MSSETRSFPGMVAWQTQTARIPPPVRRLLAFVGAFFMAVILFSVVLLLLGKDPVAAWQQIYQGSLADDYGRSEVVVKMIPFILCALAVAIPAQVGLINVGGEGQIIMGAIFTTLVALPLGAVLPAPALLPLLIVAGMVGGRLWAAIVGILRAAIEGERRPITVIQGLPGVGKSTMAAVLALAWEQGMLLNLDDVVANILNTQNEVLSS